MKRLIGLALVGLACATVCADGDRVVYENDFVTRTSEGAVPYGGWRAVNYVAGQLLANTNYSIASQFVDRDLQDNWLKAPNTGRSNAYIDDDDGNYVARLGDDSTLIVDEETGRKTGGHVMIRQRRVSCLEFGAVTSHINLTQSRRERGEKRRKLIFTSNDFSAVCIKGSRDQKLGGLCGFSLSAPLCKK